MSNASTGQRVGVVCEILELLADTRRGITCHQVAERVAMSTRACHRYLLAIEASGFARSERSPAENVPWRWFAGDRMRKVGAA